MKGTKWFSIPVAVVAILTMTVPAMAATSTSVTTGATVGGSGSPPSICAKFETPDDLSAAGTQVLPTPNTPRPMKFYAIVDDPNGINDIYGVDIAVWYPIFGGSANNTEKFNAQAQRTGPTTWVPTNAATAVRILKWGDNNAASATFDMVDMDANGTLGNAGDLPIIPALQALTAQGRLTLGPGQVLGDVNSGVIHDVMNDKQVVIEITAPIAPCQPHLNYIVKVTATDLEGNSTVTPVTNTFEYLSVVALELDFSAVNWGTINVGQENLITGDNVMNGPNSTTPTVRNAGNDRAKIMVNSTPLTGAVNGKQIKNFDAKMNQLASSDTYGPLSIQHGYIQYNAGVTATINEGVDNTPAAGTITNVPVVLPPCSTAQIDFSIFPSIPTIQDVYSGSMTISIAEYTTPVTNSAYVVLPTT